MKSTVFSVHASATSKSMVGIFLLNFSITFWLNLINDCFMILIRNTAFVGDSYFLNVSFKKQFLKRLLNWWVLILLGALSTLAFWTCVINFYNFVSKSKAFKQAKSTVAKIHFFDCIIESLLLLSLARNSLQGPLNILNHWVEANLGWDSLRNSVIVVIAAH